MTTTNTYGRQVVVPLNNKSGGSVAAGDVVILDTSNNDAFTTTTSSAFTGGIGIAQETIASNAIGRVLLSGYAALVNVNASVTRGNFGKTHTVVKQAIDAGSSRVAGTFCFFLTGGTTPDAIVWQPDLGGGSGLSDPMTTRGDIIVRNSSNTTARLAIGGGSTVLSSDGTDVSWQTAGMTQAYVGYNTTGGSNETMTSYRVYMKKVTLANDCLLTDIEAYLDLDTTNQVRNIAVAVFADSSGSPTQVISVNEPAATSVILSDNASSTARWVGLAIGRWLVAGDYWLAVASHNASGNLRIKYDTSGSDRYYTAGGAWITDAGPTPLYSVTTSSNKYSIRANTIR